MNAMDSSDKVYMTVDAACDTTGISGHSISNRLWRLPTQCTVEVTSGGRFRPAAPKSGMGVLVRMPEWTPSAVGWALASVVDAARAIEPDASDFVARITRV